MSDTPPDWVLREAAKRVSWPYNERTSDHGIVELREDYKIDRTGHRVYRALCDMIAKYEQPPVDPDVEAMKRILRVWCSVYDEELFTEVGERLARAVAQYKLERSK